MNKVVNDLDNAEIINDNIVFVDDSDNVTFFSDDMGFAYVDLNNVRLKITILLMMILKLLFKLGL